MCLEGKDISREFCRPHMPLSLRNAPPCYAGHSTAADGRGSGGPERKQMSRGPLCENIWVGEVSAASPSPNSGSQSIVLQSPRSTCWGSVFTVTTGTGGMTSGGGVQWEVIGVTTSEGKEGGLHGSPGFLAPLGPSRTLCGCCHPEPLGQSP